MPFLDRCRLRSLSCLSQALLPHYLFPTPKISKTAAPLPATLNHIPGHKLPLRLWYLSLVRQGGGENVKFCGRQSEEASQLSEQQQHRRVGRVGGKIVCHCITFSHRGGRRGDPWHSCEGANSLAFFFRGLRAKRRVGRGGGQRRRRRPKINFCGKRKKSNVADAAACGGRGRNA